MQLRQCDGFGCGHFGAPRGSRVHEGVDICAPAGSLVSVFHGGRVSKIGYCYGDDLAWRYVQIDVAGGYKFRYFYVEPCVHVGDNVHYGDVIGVAQDINQRYPGITPHLHFEILDPSGNRVDPTPVVASWGVPDE